MAKAAQPDMQAQAAAQEATMAAMQNYEHQRQAESGHKSDGVVGNMINSLLGGDPFGNPLGAVIANLDKVPSSVIKSLEAGGLSYLLNEGDTSKTLYGTPAIFPYPKILPKEVEDGGAKGGESQAPEEPAENEELARREQEAAQQQHDSAQEPERGQQQHPDPQEHDEAAAMRRNQGDDYPHANSMVDPESEHGGRGQESPALEPQRGFSEGRTGHLAPPPATKPGQQVRGSIA